MRLLLSSLLMLCSTIVGAQTTVSTLHFSTGSVGAPVVGDCLSILGVTSSGVTATDSGSPCVKNVIVTANSTAAASANTAAIQAALNAGGLVQILVPGYVYTTGTLVYTSNTRLVLGPNTTIRQAPTAAPVPTIWSSSFVAYKTGGTAVTLAQTTTTNQVVVSWTGHGFTAGQGVWLFETPTVATYGGSGNSITATNTLVAGTPVMFSGTPPTGLTAGSHYYVSATGLSSSSFEVSATSGGSVISLSGSASNLTFRGLQSPYLGVFRVAYVNNANSFTIYTKRAPAAAPTGLVAAVPAVQNFRMEGGAYNFDYATNSTGWTAGYMEDDVFLVGLIDSSVSSVYVYDAPKYAFVVQAVNNFKMEKSSARNTSDGIKFYGPIFDSSMDQWASATGDDGVSVQPQDDGVYTVQMAAVGGGDILSLHLRGLSTEFGTVSGLPNLTGGIQVYGTDGFLIDDIVIEDASSNGAPLQLTPSNVSSIAPIGSIRIKNSANTGTGASSADSVLVNTVTVDNLEFYPGSYQPGNGAQGSSNKAFITTANSTVKKLTIVGFNTNNQPSNGGFYQFITLAGTLNQVVFRDFSLINNSGGGTVFVGVTGTNSIESITFENGYADTTAKDMLYWVTAPSNTPSIVARNVTWEGTSFIELPTTGTYNVQLASDYFTTHISSSLGILHLEASSTVTVKSDGGNVFSTATFVQGTAGSPTLAVYGYDLPVSPYVATSALPGGSGTLATTAGQFCLSKSGGTNMAGPAILGNGSNWWALATGASGVNTQITQ